VALPAILVRHEKTIEINGLLCFGGHKFFYTGNIRAEAALTELAAFESGPCDSNHPWDTSFPNDEAVIELFEWPCASSRLI